MGLAIVLFLISLSSLIAALTDTLVSYWDFDDKLNDLATAGNTTDNSTWVGTADFNTGIFGNGLELNGSNYVSVPDSMDVARTGSNLSVYTWFRVDTFDKSWQCLVAKGEGSNWRIHRQGGNDLVNWTSDVDDVILWNSINNGDGTSTEQYLIADSLDQNAKNFIRTLITLRESFYLK